jgi:drug/metabolite transporter (DMT)-like permease
MVVIGGAFDVIAFVAYAIGLGIAPVWLIGLSSSLGPVLPVVYAIGWPGERPRPTQWAGLALIVAGMLALALSGQGGVPPGARRHSTPPPRADSALD